MIGGLKFQKKGDAHFSQMSDCGVKKNMFWFFSDAPVREYRRVIA
jgi:hypothetical protein